MRKRLAILLVLAAPLMAAQGTPKPAAGGRVEVRGPGDKMFIVHRERFMGKWWKNADTVKQVGVSDAQIQQMEQIFQEHRMRLIDLRAELERQEARLEPLIEADQPDEAQVNAQIDKVAATRAELEKANAQMSLGIRRVLTLDQWKKLQSLAPQHGPMRFEIPVPAPPPGGGEMPPLPPPPPDMD